MRQERHEVVIVQVARTEMAADLHADVTGAARARGLAAGQVEVLQRDLGQRLEPIGPVGAVLQGQVVHPFGPRRGRRRRIAIAEQDGRGTDDLDVDRVALHLLDPQHRVPQCAVDRAEAAAAGHDVAVLAVRPDLQPRGSCGVETVRLLPRHAREEVGVHVNFHHLGHVGFAGESQACLPRCSLPQAGHRRAVSLR